MPDITPADVDRLPWDDEEDFGPEHGDMDPSGCWNCEGNQTWCSLCGVWTRTCCEDYGDCPCN